MISYYCPLATLNVEVPRLFQEMICGSDYLAAISDSVAARIYIVYRTVLATTQFEGKTFFGTLRKGVMILCNKWSCNRFCGA
jgi:hypothetical protein